MASGMVLPDEILIAVLRSIPMSDLKKARLTCRRWSKVGAESLFRRVYSAPRDEEMQLFANIASQPIFSRTITELGYDGRLYISAYTDGAQFLSEYYSLFYPEELDRQSESNGDWGSVLQALAGDDGEAKRHAHAKDIFAQYGAAVSAQQEILTNGKDFGVLHNGLKRMSNITTISLLDAFGSNERQEWPPINETQYSKFLERTATQLQPCGWLDRPGWHDCLPWETSNGPKWDTRGIDHLSLALSKCCSSIKRMRTGSPPSHVPMQVFGAASPTLEYLQRIASNLVELTIDFVHRAWAPDPEDRKEELSGVNSIITQSKQLSKLSLCLSQEFELSCVNFNNLHLDTLSLADVQFAHWEFLTMVMSSQRTLRNLHLRGLLVSTRDDMTWRSLADRCGQLLKLYCVSLMGLLEVGVGGHFRPYLSTQELLDVAGRMLSWASPQALFEQSRDVANERRVILDSERWIIVKVDTACASVLAEDEAASSP